MSDKPMQEVGMMVDGINLVVGDRFIWNFHDIMPRLVPENLDTIERPQCIGEGTWEDAKWGLSIELTKVDIPAGKIDLEEVMVAFAHFIEEAPRLVVAVILHYPGEDVEPRTPFGLSDIIRLKERVEDSREEELEAWWQQVEGYERNHRKWAKMRIVQLETESKEFWLSSDPPPGFPVR